MKRLLIPLLALLALTSVTATTSAGAATGTRYVDQVFPSTTLSTAVYRTTTDLVTGAPLALRTDVIQPTGDTLAARPAIVWIHGGGFKGGSRTSMDPVAAEWARRGYVTLSIDYRLDPGNRCQDVQDGVITDPAQLATETARCKRAIEAAQADALEAVAWVRSHAATYRVDPLRVAVGGSSAGAVTAVNVAERANPLGGVIPARYRVGAALAMSGCNYDPASIDAYDRPVALLASGHDQAVDFGCVTTTADTAQAKGNIVQRTFYPTESGHALSLYRTHQAAVDAKWTAFLIARLHL